MIKIYLPYKIINLINSFLGLSYWENRNKLSLINLLIDYKYSNWYYEIKNKLNWNEWNIRNTKNYSSIILFSKMPLKFNKLYTLKKSFLNEIDIFQYILFININNNLFLDFIKNDYFEKKLRRIHSKYSKLVYQ